MTDLSTTYLGLKLKNPIVVSAGPLQREVDAVREMEEAGAAAVVMHSLFEEQIEIESEELNRFLEQGTRELRRVAALPSRPGELQPRTRSLPGTPGAGEEGGAHPRHRQPERQFDGRVDALRQDDGRSRRRRHRAEHLLCGRQSRDCPARKWSRCTTTWYAR